MSNDLNPNELAELSRHYDTMLWSVTSLWAAAIGGLLVYCHEHFDPWLAAFGLILTVCAMYFAYSFRSSRRRLHDCMGPNLRKLYVGSPGLRQWDILALLFFALICLWAKLLLQNACPLWPFWLLLTLAAAVLVFRLWQKERRTPELDS